MKTNQIEFDPIHEAGRGWASVESAHPEEVEARDMTLMPPVIPATKGFRSLDDLSPSPFEDFSVGFADRNNYYTR